MSDETCSSKFEKLFFSFLLFNILAFPFWCFYVVFISDALVLFK